MLVFLMNEVGTYVSFIIQRQVIQSEMKYARMDFLDNSQLTAIKVSASAAKGTLQWEDDHEFRYQGKMYDVVRQEPEGDNTIFYCFNDSKEDVLFDTLEEETDEKMKDKTSLLKKTSTYVKGTLSVFQVYLKSDPTQYHSFNNFYLAPSLASLPQPPEAQA
jgi:hypothetical protein